METLAQVAERILETAQQAPGSNWTVLITHAGQTQMIAATEPATHWPLESLLAERGAAMAFRVTHQPTAISVEGRSLGHRCRLESAKPFPRAPRPAEMPRLLRARWG